MSKAIDEMRAYFNQPPMPPAGALLEHRKKVNRWLDEAEAENAKLRKLVRGLNYCSDELTSAECDKCPANDPTDEHLGPTCLKMMEELGIEGDE